MFVGFSLFVLFTVDDCTYDIRNDQAVFINTSSVGTVEIPDSINYNSTNIIVTSMEPEINEYITSVTIKASQIEQIIISNFTHLNQLILDNTIEEISPDYIVSSNIYFDINLPDSLIVISSASFQFNNLKNIVFGSKLTKIGDNAFMNKEIVSFKSKTVCNIKEIGKFAFHNCNKLVEIDLNLLQYVKKISDFTFYNCSSLSFPVLQIKATEIGQQAFSKSKILNIILKSIKTIKLGAFEFVDSLQTVDIQSDNVIIENFAFQNSSIIYFALTSNKCSIGNNCFANCHKLISVQIHEASISRNAFLNCYALSIVNISFSNKIIPQYAFSSCYGINSFETLSNLNEIHDTAFFNCTFIGSLIVKSKSIANNAFYCCDFSHLTLIIPFDMEIVPNEPISSPKSLKLLDIIIERNFTLKESLIKNCNLQILKILKADTQKEINLTIDESVFYKTQKIDIKIQGPSITLESDIVYFGANSFFGSEYISSIQIISDNIHFAEYAFYKSSISELILGSLHKNSKARISDIGKYCFYGSKIRDFQFINRSEIIPIEVVNIGAFSLCADLRIIPKVTKMIHQNSFSNTPVLILDLYAENIGSYAFMSCNLLKKIFIHGTVKNIAPQMLQFCDNLELIEYLNEEGAMMNISNYCFENMKFTQIIFCNRISVIGEGAFLGSQIQGSLFLPPSITKICDRAFEGCNKLRGILNISHCDNLTHIGSMAFIGCSELYGQLNLPRNLITIGSNAFSQTKFNGNIEIPDKVEVISDSAFYKCTMFTGFISIGSSVKLIGLYAFSGCNALTGMIVFTNINVSNFVISGYAFYDCAKLSGQLILPPNTVSIGPCAFYYCQSLSSELILPNSLKIIDEYAFAYCKSLIGYLHIPSNVSYIGDHAFLNCIGLHRIYLEGKSTGVGRKAFGSMNFECISNLPKNCSSKMKVSECYDTKNKDKLTQIYILGENCSLLVTARILIAIFGILTGSAVISIATTFYLFVIKERSSQKQRFQTIYSEIIRETVEDMNKNKTEENVSANKISNKINDKMSREVSFEEFILTKRICEKLLAKALDMEWPSIPMDLYLMTMSLSFADVRFTKRRFFTKKNFRWLNKLLCCKCCHDCCKCKKSRRQFSESIDMNSSLL